MEGQLVDEALMGALYGTALHEGDWRPALERFRVLLGSAETALCNLGDDATVDCLETTQRVLGYEHAIGYSDHYGRIDPKQRILDVGGPGFLFNDARHFDDDFVARDPFYQEFARAIGTRHTLDLFVHSRSGKRVYLAAMRAPRQGAYGRRCESLFRQASMHFVRALALKEKLNAARCAQSALDRLKFGIAVLDAMGRVTLANRAALEFVASHPGLRLCQGELSAGCVSDARKLASLIATALAGRGGCAELSVSLGESFDRTFWSVPLREPDILPGATAPGALLVFGCSSERVIDPRAVAATYGLSKAEVRVAVALARGDRPAGIAKRCGLKPSTVRTQLLSVLRKMGVHRQADVTRLLLAGAQASPVVRDEKIGVSDCVFDKNP